MQRGPGSMVNLLLYIPLSSINFIYNLVSFYFRSFSLALCNYASKHTKANGRDANLAKWFAVFLGL